MEKSHQLWLLLQLVNVVDSFLSWWACWEELAWGAFDNNCVGVVVSDDGDKRDAVEAVFFAPTAQDGSSRHRDDGIMLVVDVDLVAGEDCGVACVGEARCADEG